MSTPASSDVRNQVRCICESVTFRSAPQVSRLLIFLVDATLEGDPLKESVIGSTFFSRPSGYDPQVDPVVRTEVRRLRLKLGEYYFKEGSNAPVFIEIPAGAYKARFTMREASQPEAPLAPPPVTEAAVRSRRIGLPVKALAGAAVLVLVATTWLLPRVTGGSPAGRRSVAVFRLRDLAGAGETAWLGRGLSEMIAADLSASAALRIIPMGDAARTRLDLDLGDTDSLGPAELGQIRRDLGVDLVVAGSYASIGPAGSREYRIDLQIYDARTGQPAGSVSDTDTGDERTLFDMLSRLGAKIDQQVGVKTTDARLKQPLSTPSAWQSGLGLAKSLCLKADLLPYGSADKERLYRQSLEIGRKESSGPWEVDPLIGLAKIQAARRDFVKAADFYRQGYEVTRKYYGADHGATAAAKILWARSRIMTGEVREAIEQIKEAIPVARRGFPADSLRLWNILHDSIHACNDNGAFREAESYTIEALAINERLHLPPTSERWGMLYWDLGRAQRGQKNYRDAISTLEKAEADFQQFQDTRKTQVRADIEQVKVEQRGGIARTR